MSRVQYFTACTLDGFIADEFQSLDWLFEAPHSDDDGAGGTSSSAAVGPMVMGATTYEWVLAHDDMVSNPQKWRDYYEGPALLGLLAPRPAADSDRRHPVRVRRTSARCSTRWSPCFPDKNIWIVGGGDLVGQFDDAGLLDEVWLGMHPVFLGAGAPLLPRRITTSRLTLREVRHSGQQVRLILDVSRHT